MKIKKSIHLRPIPQMICMGLAVLFCSLTEGSNDLSQIVIYSLISIGFAILPCITLVRVVPYTKESETQMQYE